MNQQNMTMTWTLELHSMEVHIAFAIVDCVCNFWFSLELITRFVSCPNRKQFFLRFVNIVDIIATMSFYMDLVIWVGGLEDDIIFEHPLTHIMFHTFT